MNYQKISIAGTGYVGLCTAVGFASKGYKTITSTHNSKKEALINRGIPPFYEPGLNDLLRKVVKEGYLKCVLDLEEAIQNTDITFIAVGTPSKPDGSIELQYIEDSAHEIGKILKKKSNHHLIVVKSTVIPGTTEKIVKPTIQKSSNKKCGVNFGLCMNPEFLREGSALHDTFYPDRVVIGEYDEKSGEILEAVYRDFYSEEAPPIIRTNLPTAELIKYASNACLATKISFINQIANLCEKIPGADVTVVSRSIGLDKRIGPSFLNAGLGYGGSCFPKDVKALLSFSKSLSCNLTLLETTQEINESQPHRAIQLCKTLLGDLEEKRIAILGLAFKPDTDDIRESVSSKIINELIKENAYVITYDPVASDNAKKVFRNKIRYAKSATECIRGSDCCIIVTEWEEFKQLKPEDFIQHMKKPVIIDGRRIYDPKEFGQKLTYKAIGYGQEITT